MFSIFRVLISGTFVYMTVLAFYVVFGQTFGFILYHLSLATFFVMGSFAEPSTIRMYVIGFVIIVFATLLKKARSIFS